MSIDLSGLITKEAKELSRLKLVGSTVRAERDRLLELALVVRDRHRDELELGIETTITPEAYSLVLNYIQDLRNVPQQGGFPDDIEWPEVPELVREMQLREQDFG